MRQLNFDLKTLQARHREGAFGTRRDRSYVLDQAANLLHELGFRRLVHILEMNGESFCLNHSRARKTAPTG